MAHVNVWVFDLDNTLYPPEIRLFDQIEQKMRQYISEHLSVDLEEADDLRAQYWREHGTTLAGLMAHHAIDPMHFLDAVHDIDFTALTPDPELGASIARLPGQKVIYTNGDSAYAARVLAARGLEGLFDAIFGIEDAGFVPKPQRVAFETVFAKIDLETERAAMFEDDIRNLRVPHAMGMRTVLVHTDGPEEDHIHHRTTDLPHFLSQLAPPGLP